MVKIMAEIIKINDKHDPVMAKSGEITNWQVKSYDEQDIVKQKIIKGVSIDKQKIDKEVTVIRSEHDVPEIKTIGSGKNIEGIDIKCTCGETIRVYFDYEEEE